MTSSTTYRFVSDVGSCLFNDAVNTFYLRVFGVGHKVKDHSDSDRKESHCRHFMGYVLRLAARDLFYAG